MQTATPTPTTPIAGLNVDMFTRGDGRPLLFLHPAIGIEPDAPVIEKLAQQARVIAPTHPGFGRTPASAALGTVDDLSYFYLDLMKELDLRDAIVVGVSFGAWLAAEIAVKSTARISALVLANAVGIKVGPRDHRDIVDIFAITETDFHALAYADPARAKVDHSTLPDAQLLAIARNREASARYGWSPYMHNPKLRGRLHRIDVPTLVLWGAEDRIVSPDYGRAYADSIPGAEFELVERAGHFPHVEQPDEFARRVFAFAAHSARQPN
jgi:pimeloyl-ACP methyl ester carboxylesterase